MNPEILPQPFYDFGLIIITTTTDDKIQVVQNKFVIINLNRLQKATYSNSKQPEGLTFPSSRLLKDKETFRTPLRTKLRKLVIQSA